MNDRDSYPDDPSRGRVDRGYDYDPLTDPVPTQPRPRGRRARPEPETPNERFDGDGRPQPRRAAGDPRARGDRRAPGEPRTPGRAPHGGAAEDPLGPGAPAPGRRRKPGPPPGEPPRRGGAADALRGGRAARSATGRPRGLEADRPQPPGTPDHQPPAAAEPRRGAADPTRDALAALADLGGQNPPTAPSAPPEDPPRRGRRARPAEEPGSPSPLWGEDDGPMPSFLADEPEEERRPRRGRRKREAPDGPPAAGRGRRPAPDPPQEEAGPPSEAFDGPATGPTPVVDGPRRGRRRRARQEEPHTPPPAEEPPGRRGRRRASRGAAPEPAAEETGFLADVPADTAALAAFGAGEEAPSDPRRDEGRTDASADDSAAYDAYEDHDARDDTAAAEEEASGDDEPAGRRGRRRRRGRGDEEPAGRRGRRRRGGRRAAAAAEPEPADERSDAVDDEDDGYEEPNLNDIAEAYGGSRRKRKQLKQAQKSRRAGGSRGRGRRSGKLTAAAVVLVLVIGAGGYGAFRYLVPADYSGEGTGEVVFVIESGQSGSAVGEALVEAGVVASVRAFTEALGDAEAEGGGGLEPGTYSLAENMSAESAVAALLDDTNRLGGRVTVPEGLRAQAVEGGDGILQSLSEQLGIPVADLEAAYADTDSLGLPEYATQGPEGYLFPETYRFDPGAEPGAVLRTMVTQFRQVAEEVELERRAEAIGYDPNQVMAIASIVQAESGREEDMANISSVVHNRLDQGMPLQMDSTCFYVLGTHGLALTQEQQIACENDPGEYGTYGRVGLPAGPFVAPGRAAIEAALEPADTDYLYFALINPETGETGFSRTLDEHTQMVNEYSDSW
ncbi:endolytic transglycosylase MltG [Nocardiopsis sp. FIRDI 009]|uniref:endolytic transglycosylase MltG n=1 Tax=Nocardiopsis sp. FIRDI 009 TaxID=714197 RepID=UPI000E21DD2B|nr:endolytic transglycosylase MltG [Nocardiopsis sp. FIRDI 009]